MILHHLIFTTVFITRGQAQFWDYENDYGLDQDDIP